MLRVCCVKVGTLYDARYVNVLANSVMRNLASGTAGTFHCFTDDAQGIDGHIQVHNVPPGYEGWYAKLWIFKDGIFDDGDRIVYFDLDTVILGALDDIVKYDGHFAVLRDFFKPHDDVQSAVMAWPANTQEKILETWLALDSPILEGGDQQMIQMSLEERGIKPDFLQDLFPKKFVSYKSGSYKRIPPKGAAVVCFHGQPKPHNCGSNWVDGVWKIDGSSAFEIEQICNTEERQIEDNIRHAMSLPIPWLSLQPEHGRTAVIVGGAPSLKKTIGGIATIPNADVFACNNTARVLRQHYFRPDYHVLVDARPDTAGFINRDSLDANQYLIASQCDRSVFDAIGNAPAIIFHPKIKGIVEAIQNDDRSKCLVGGGSTVCLKAMAIAYIMGYRKFHLFGMDSSYSGSEHHAYPQPINDGDIRVQVQVDDKFFWSTPWMVAQADEFDELILELMRLGCTFEIEGDGLIPYIARDRIAMANAPAVQLRAHAILDRIPDGEVIGAEIGVFAGDLSQRLLARENLRLHMVDSWLGNGASYAPCSDDFHASLSQAQQDAYRAHASLVTDFASNRRTIMAMDSVEAALQIRGDTLDFVFIDADHSYEGCKRDIAAWYPRLKDGGLLSGHDYDHPEYPSWGVKRAVDEFAKSHGLAIDLGENMTWFITKPLAKEIAA